MSYHFPTGRYANVEASYAYAYLAPNNLIIHEQMIANPVINQIVNK
ncbi:hypothetical protein [Nostoc sp.]